MQVHKVLIKWKGLNLTSRAWNILTENGNKRTMQEKINIIF